MTEIDFLYSVRAALGGAEALPFWSFITHLGDKGLVWYAITLWMLAFACTRRAGITMGAAMLASWLAADILKGFFYRLRPCRAPDGVNPEDLLTRCSESSSFPSAHTMASFAALVAFSCWFPRAGLSLLTLGILIAWSRLYLFVHYPSDVAGGMLIGTLCAAFGIWLTRKTFTRPLERQ